MTWAGWEFLTSVARGRFLLLCLEPQRGGATATWGARRVQAAPGGGFVAVVRESAAEPARAAIDLEGPVALALPLTAENFYSSAGTATFEIPLNLASPALPPDLLAAVRSFKVVVPRRDDAERAFIIESRDGKPFLNLTIENAEATALKKMPVVLQFDTGSTQTPRFLVEVRTPGLNIDDQPRQLAVAQRSVAGAISGRDARLRQLDAFDRGDDPWYTSLALKRALEQKRQAAPAGREWRPTSPPSSYPSPILLRVSRGTQKQT